MTRRGKCPSCDRRDVVLRALRDTEVCTRCKREWLPELSLYVAPEVIENRPRING